MGGRIQMFRPRERKDPMDDVIKGLQIAQGIFGIKANLDRAEALKKQSAMEQEKFDIQYGKVGPEGDREGGLLQKQLEAKAKEKEEKAVIAKEVREDRKLARQTAASTKQRQMDEKAFDTAINKTEGIGRGSQSSIGGIVRRERLSRDALRIIDLVEKEGLVPTRQVAQELATTMASLLVGGNAATQGAIEDLIPESAKGSFADKKQFITGNPEVFLNKPFLDQFKHQLVAQQDFYSKEFTKTLRSVEIGLEPVLERNPDLQRRWQEQVNLLQERRRSGGDSMEAIATKTPPRLGGILPAAQGAPEQSFDWDAYIRSP